MKLLVAAATEAEIGIFMQYLQLQALPTGPMQYLTKQQNSVQACITGVGMVATAYNLTRALQKSNYDMVLQVGVGGAFDRTLELGSVYFITSEQYGDLGAEDHYNFIDVFDLGLEQANVYPFSGKKLQTPDAPLHAKIDLPRVSGLTINAVSGSDFTIKRREEKYNCQVESMEGAAFHYVCLQEKVPFAQVRSISNYVEPRDKSKWQMKDAIIALNKWLIDFLETI
ncbi:MAG: futalosine hydrolase [Bacteroidetes bacterium]|nr:futalosine hydrolase [Bacteroidota bacterium]